MPQKRFQTCCNPKCRVTFYPIRSDALTCSPACRQAFKRHCDAITAAITRPAATRPKKVKKPSVRNRKG